MLQRSSAFKSRIRMDFKDYVALNQSNHTLLIYNYNIFSLHPDFALQIRIMKSQNIHSDSDPFCDQESCKTWDEILAPSSPDGIFIFLKQGNVKVKINSSFNRRRIKFPGEECGTVWGTGKRMSEGGRWTKFIASNRKRKDLGLFTRTFPRAWKRRQLHPLLSCSSTPWGHWGCFKSWIWNWTQSLFLLRVNGRKRWGYASTLCKSVYCSGNFIVDSMLIIKSITNDLKHYL